MKIDQFIGLMVIGTGVMFATLAPEVGALAIVGFGVLMLFRVVQVGTVEDKPSEPTLYRYEVDIKNAKSATVYATSIDIPNPGTYIFEDAGEIVAIYSRVTRIVAHKVLSEED